MLLGFLNKMISTVWLALDPTWNCLNLQDSLFWIITLSCLKMMTVLKPITVEELKEIDSLDRNSWGWAFWLNMFVWFFHYFVTCHCCVVSIVWSYLSLSCHFEHPLWGYCKQGSGKHTAAHLLWACVLTTISVSFPCCLRLEEDEQAEVIFD